MQQRVIWATASAAVSLIVAGGAAQAQSIDDFKRDYNVSVRERPRPDYEALGLRTGAFLVYPKITLGGDLDDNIYATDQGKQSDTIVLIQPEVNARSNWSRNEVAGYIRGVFNEYLSHSTESTSDFSLGGSGRLDIQRSSDVSGGIDYGHLSEPRISPNTVRGTTRPIRYDMLSGYVAGREEMDRLRLVGRLDVQSYSYQNAVDLSGRPVLQQDRDRTEASANGRAEYAVSPALYVFGSATVNTRDYRLKPPRALLDRDSHGYDLSAGANFDVTHLVRGEAQVGYFSQQYASGVFHDVSGLSFKGQLEWFPTQLTTVTGNFGRSVQDAADPRAVSFVSTTAGVQVDHELLRNVILTARTAYETDRYNGVDRYDRQWTTRLSGTYLLNRHWGVTAYYSHIDVRSSGLARIGNYKVNQLALALVFQL